MPTFFFFKKGLSIYLKVKSYRQKEGGEVERERDVDLPFFGSLPKWAQWLEPDQSEARNPEPLFGLSQARAPTL